MRRGPSCSPVKAGPMLPRRTRPYSPNKPAREGEGALPPLIASLLRPDAYPHAANDLRLRETHISLVVLAGPYAYKTKKPVSLGFLDFSTVQKRAHACAEEVRLNRRLCPDVYLGVVDIVERRGQFYVGGPGRPVEPAVWMRRLPEEGMLPNLLAAGAADASLVRRIAHHLVRFHATAATGSGVDEYGRLDVLRANWDENFAQTAPFVGRTLSRTAWATITAYVQRFLTEKAALLESRVVTGHIRDGHGDLHAASICVEGDRLHLFDCIEFSPRYRCSDVAAEVAFLAMDLDHYGRPDLAAAFVEAYVRESGDRDLLGLVDFYKCYRAYVRGKVLSIRLNEVGLSPAQQMETAEQARSYFRLALAYTSRAKREELPGG